MTLVGNKPWADGPYQLISNAKVGVKVRFCISTSSLGRYCLLGRV